MSINERPTMPPPPGHTKLVHAEIRRAYAKRILRGSDLLEIAARAEAEERALEQATQRVTEGEP